MEDTTRLCPECGKAMPPVKHGGRGGLKRFCSERCRVRVYRREHPEYVAKSREQGQIRAQKKAAERELADPRPRCRNCGKEMARRAGSTHCSAPECQSAKYRAGLADRPRCSEPSCTRPVIAKGLCGSHYKKVWLEANPGRADVWHSARRARVAAAFVEDVPLHALLERDGWTCGICEKPIPRDAVWPDRQSPSLDHVIPLSKGGEHSWANSQAAHLSCNARKGASTPDAITAAA